MPFWLVTFSSILLMIGVETLFRFRMLIVLEQVAPLRSRLADVIAPRLSLKDSVTRSWKRLGWVTLHI